LLAILVAGNVVMFTAGLEGGAGIARLVFMSIPLIIALVAGRWPAGLAYIAASLAAFGLEQLCLSGTLGVATIIVGGAASLVARLLPTAMMGYVALTVIRVSDLMAALERWRLPAVVVIPCAVILRFLPTAFEQNRAVAQAMRMRGLAVLAVGPRAWLEYRTVPLVVATVNAGEELAQAALTRALGGPCRPRRLADVRFRPYDAVLLAMAVAALIIWALG